MNHSFFPTRATLALAAALLATPALSATRTYPGAAPCAGTLQACLDGADADDVIELAGDNAETLEITRSVTLRSSTGTRRSVGNVLVMNSAGNLQVRLEGLTVTGGLTGLLLAGGSLQLQVINNVFPGPGGPAIELRTHANPGVYGSIDADIDHNRITVSGDESSCVDGIAVSLSQSGESASTIRLRGNDIMATDLYQCAGISVYQTQGRQNLTVESNRLHGTRFNNGISVWALGGQVEAGIFNNLVYGQSGNRGGPGAIVVSADGNGDNAARVTAHVVNNTVAHNDTGMWVSARADLGAVLDGSMRNNIAAFNTKFGLYYTPADVAPGFVESHNLLHANGEPEGGTPAGPFRRTGNPGFANAAAGDYRLTPSSDALNHGQTSALPALISTDLGGTARVVGSAIDIGAYEYPRVIATPPVPPVVTPVPALGPWGLLLLGPLLGLAAWWRRDAAPRH